MRAFFDTSVLLPVLLENHEHHEASLKVLLKAKKATGCFGAHSLAELYATATRLPGKHRLSGEQVILFLEDLTSRLSAIALNASEYLHAVRTAAGNNVAGGAIYDALLAQCALKGEADVIYTWNVRHFQLLGADVRDRLRTPSSPQ